MRLHAFLASILATSVFAIPRVHENGGFSVDKVPLGIKVSVRLVDDRTFTEARVKAVTTETVTLSRQLENILETQTEDLTFPRGQVFRFYCNGNYYSDLPISQERHKVVKDYIDFLMQFGDYAVTSDGTKNVGLLVREQKETIELSMIEGNRIFTKANLRSWRTGGRIMEGSAYLPVSDLDIEKFAAAFSEQMPDNLRSSAISVDAHRTPPGNRGAENLGQMVRQRIAKKLIERGFKVYNRENLKRVLSEKELSQQGVTVGKDKTLESAAQIDIIIAGSVRELADKSGYSIQADATSSRDLRLIMTKEAQLKNSSEDSGGASPRHSGFYFNFSFGYGYGNIATDGFDPLNSLSLYGNAFMTQLRGGFAIRERTILGLGMQGNILNEPFIAASPDILTEKKLTGRFFNYVLTGPFFQYYTANDYFISATAGSASAFYRDTKKQMEISNGFGASLSIGHEWPISRYFGLGLALHLNYAYVPLADIDTAFLTTNGTISDNNFRVSMWSAHLGITLSYN